MVRDIELKVRLDNPPIRVLQQPEDRALNYQFQDGILQAVVPDMHIHTAVVIEKSL
jgi:hypothetical protein